MAPRPATLNQALAVLWALATLPGDVGTGKPRQQKIQKQLNSKPTKSRRRVKLLNYKDIPQWQQENEYILSGYRPTSGSLADSLAGLCYLNNETVSTWSHLLGCLFFLALPAYIYSHVFTGYSSGGWSDVLVLSIYCLGVAICFALSALCHIVWNHSPAVAGFGIKLDYVGILVLMWSASVPTIYYGFSCDKGLRWFHWGLVTSMALACAICTLDVRFGEPRFRRWRAALYAVFGMSSAIFIVHGLVIHGWEAQKRRMSLTWIAWMAGFNLVGAAAYASRVPERWLPYRFDIVGASHQIFHVAVVLAAAAHVLGLLDAVEVHHSQLAPCVHDSV